jgi:hypothetical protein
LREQHPRHCEEQSDEGIQLAETIEILDCFASLAMTSRQTSAFSQSLAPE